MSTSGPGMIITGLRYYQAHVINSRMGWDLRQIKNGMEREIIFLLPDYFGKNIFIYF